MSAAVSEKTLDNLPTTVRQLPNRALIIAASAGCAAPLAFAWIHHRLESGPWGFAQGDGAAVRGALTADVARYLALAGGAVVLVVLRRRRLFFLPALAYSLTPWIVGWNDLGCDWPPSRALVAVGGGWPWPSVSGCVGLLAAGPFGVAVDLGLTLLPAGALLVATKAPAEPRQDARATLATRLGLLALVTFVVWSIAWVKATTGYGGSPLRSLAPNLVPLLLFGLLAATLRLPWIAALVVFPVLLTTSWPAPLAATGVWPTLPEVRDALPYLVTPLIAASWVPLASLIDRMARRPVAMLTTVNVLNVTDAVLTDVGVRSGEAVEANPVVRLLGLPLKVVLVAILSLILFRTRPRILNVAALALTGVLAWHFAGFAASPR